MKGTPDAPQCGFQWLLSNILKILEVNFKGVNVLADQNIREGIKVLVIGQQFHNYMLKKNLLVVVILSKKCMKVESLAKLFED